MKTVVLPLLILFFLGGVQSWFSFESLSLARFSPLLSLGYWREHGLTILQIIIRFALAGAMAWASVKCFMAVFEWVYWEENAVKAYESKYGLGKMLIIITVIFVLMALFHLWVPDYNALTV